MNRPTTGARSVVAVLLTSGDRIKLLRRSSVVGHDRGLWHCVTGYLPAGTAPGAQALDELREETGLTGDRLTGFRLGPVLVLPGEAGDSWVVHTFACEIDAVDVTLNWESDAQKWIDPAEVGSPDQVVWLADVVDAFSVTASTTSGLARTDHPSSPAVTAGAPIAGRKA